MNLRFSIPPEVLRQRGAEISQLMMGVLPGSATHIDEGRGILFVTLPQGLHPALATDTVIRALAGIGITAYFMADAPNYVPPIQVGEKKRRGVSLPVFPALGDWAPIKRLEQAIKKARITPVRSRWSI